ncbi:hypothetical protein [Haladaptatus sp. NG-WS-4]
MAPLRVHPPPTRLLTLAFVAGLLLAGSLGPYASSTGDARVPPPTTSGEETTVTFQCYEATVDTNTSVTAILHFPDGREQQVLTPGTHTVRGTGNYSGEPLVAITIATGNDQNRYENPLYPDCDQNRTTTTTTTTQTTTATPPTTTTTTTTTTPTTTTTATPTTTTTTEEGTTTTETRSTTSPPSTAAPRQTTTTTATGTTAAPGTAVATETTTETGTTSRTGTNTATEKTSEPESSTDGTTAPNGSGGGSDTGKHGGNVPLPGSDEPKNRWTLGDILALLVVCTGGILVVGPSMSAYVYSWLDL